MQGSVVAAIFFFHTPFLNGIILCFIFYFVWNIYSEYSCMNTKKTKSIISLQFANALEIYEEFNSTEYNVSSYLNL